MRFNRILVCIAVSLVYLAIRVLALWPIDISSHALQFALAVVLTAVTMFFQLTLIFSVVRLRMTPLHTVLLTVCSGTLVALILYNPDLMMHVMGPFLPLGHDLFLILFATSLGYFISFIIREPNILLPAVVFAGLVDYWGVSMGPVGNMVKNAPTVVAKASVAMPTVTLHGIRVASMIGMGDFLFMALFLGVLYRFSLNAKGAFWLGFGLLTLAMLAVMATRIPAVPALLPMGVAVLATNMKAFNLKRDEIFATLYVGIILLVFIGLYAYGHRT